MASRAHWDLEGDPTEVERLRTIISSARQSGKTYAVWLAMAAEAGLLGKDVFVELKPTLISIEAAEVVFEGPKDFKALWKFPYITKWQLKYFKRMTLSRKIKHNIQRKAAREARHRRQD